MFSAYLRLLLLSIPFLAAPVHADDPPLQASLTQVSPRLTAPGFDLLNLDGQQISLSSMKGKVVIVNFWATWCPPCRREFSSMERLGKIMSGRPLEILPINVGETVEVIEGFTATLDSPPLFQMLLDREGDAMAMWPVRGLPTTFIVDKRGRIAYRAVGGREFDNPQIVNRIERLLREK
jgi:thiol-disulfide isomerase/thioredoxin